VLPLSAYRRTGADLPFGDPRRAHGTAFEGYYWRLTDVAAGRVAIVLCGVCRDAGKHWPGGPGSLWAVAALARSDGLVRERIEPLAEVSFGGLGVRAGASVVGDDERLRVDLGPDARLDVRFEERAEWGRRPLGGIGAGHLAPGLPQYWHPHLLGGVVRGGEWDGATVYAEKNWGPRFTEHWWWGQAQGFPGADACVAFAGGRVLGAAPTSVVVRVEERMLRLAPPFARVATAVGEGAWRVRTSSPRWTVELEGEALGDPAVLPVPVVAERRTEDRAQQHLTGRLAVRVLRGGRVWWSGESELAGLERWL
jgi:hypothetical protein